MTTNLMDLDRDSGASVRSTGCTTAATKRDLDALVSRTPAAQRIAGPAGFALPMTGAAAAAGAETAPGTPVWSPPT